MKKVYTLIVASAFLACNSGNNAEQATSAVTPEAAQQNQEPMPMSKKKELMTKLIGTHELNSIEAGVGANGMISYSKEKNGWNGTYSSIVDGMREGEAIESSAEEKKMLSSLAIVVKEDLSVAIAEGTKELFVVPFKEDGFDYFLKKSPKEYTSYMSDKLTPQVTFLEGKLYLLAKDGLNSSSLGNLDIATGTADGIVLVLDEATSKFQMNLFNGDCCDNATYVFE